MSPDQPAAERIRFELGQVEKELKVVDRLNAPGLDALDEIQVRAAATVLHSVYNGIEKILLMALEERKVKIGESAHWHSEVLSYAASTGIISEHVLTELRDFLGFRHFFRHNYGFILDDQLVKPLMAKVRLTVSQFASELEQLG